jgi:hypothetical protein
MVPLWAKKGESAYGGNLGLLRKAKAPEGPRLLAFVGPCWTQRLPEPRAGGAWGVGGEERGLLVVLGLGFKLWLGMIF